MRAKRIFVVLSIILVLLASIIEVSNPKLAMAASGSTTVYITNYGECYHTAYCRYLNKSSISVSLSTAVKRGYRRCSVCNPPYLTHEDYDEDEIQNNNKDKYNGTRAEKTDNDAGKIFFIVIISAIGAIIIFNIVCHIVNKIETKKEEKLLDEMKNGIDNDDDE